MKIERPRSYCWHVNMGQDYFRIGLDQISWSELTRIALTFLTCITAKHPFLTYSHCYFVISQETVAAVKVQSIVRRNQAMSDVEARGGSTAAIRNRSRARARSGSKNKAFHSDDAPDLLACCGVGFLFGDATEEDQAVLAEERRKEYQEMKRQQELEEAERRKYRYRKKASDHVNEEFEVLDS